MTTLALRSLPVCPCRWSELGHQTREIVTMNNVKNIDPPRTIFATMMRVQSDLAKKGISKDQKNTQQGWKFRGIDDVLNALSGVLAENKALIIPDVIDKQKLDSPKGSHWLVTVNWMMIDEYGDSLVSRHCGEAIDYGDKGLNKAITSSYKYFLFSALCIPLIGQEFGDADQESPGEEEVKPKQRKKKSTPRKKGIKPLSSALTELKVIEPTQPSDDLKKAREELEKMIGYQSILIKDSDENGPAEFKTTIDADIDTLRSATSKLVEKYPELKLKLHGLGTGYAQIIQNLGKQDDKTAKQVAS